MKYKKGDKVWERRRKVFASVLFVCGAALDVEDESGARWTTRDVNCMPAAEAEDQAAPYGTRPVSTTPSDVHVHDYVWVAGAYREVVDMRSKSAIGGKILVLKGHGPWVMTSPGTVYRPTRIGAPR